MGSWFLSFGSGLTDSIDDFQCDPEGQEKPGEDLEGEFFVHN
jgi:hypothetical protein